jgi:hypothetical protein
MPKMSHDRGCYCGRERYEYEDCPRKDCHKKNLFKEELKMPTRPKAYRIFREKIGRTYNSKEIAIAAAKAEAEMYPDEKIFIAELKEYYVYEQPKKTGKIIRRYYKPEKENEDVKVQEDSRLFRSET